MLIGQAAASFYSGRGQTQVVMWTDAAFAILNVLLDYLWIFGYAGFPEWGVAGAAWATVVSMWLPLSAKPAETGDERAPKFHSAGAVTERILVVDDDEGVRRFIVERLEMIGYSVSEASDGPSGLELLKAAAPDLLIVDFAMAGMTGLEVAEAARLVAPDLPIILATGYAETASIEEIQIVQRVLRKPFQMDELAGTVRGVLETSALETAD